jgi:RNA polymerase sigma-70 factor (ECF subfamily)
MGIFERELVTHLDSMMKFALKLERDTGRAENLVQETVLAALEGKDTFKGTSTFKTWLLAIMKNKSASHYYKSKRIEYGTPAYEEALETLHCNPNQLDSIALRQLCEYLDALPAKHKDVLVGQAFEGLSEGEMSERYRIPPGTVKSRLFHARKALAQYLPE